MSDELKKALSKASNKYEGMYLFGSGNNNKINKNKKELKQAIKKGGKDYYVWEKPIDGEMINKLITGGSYENNNLSLGYKMDKDEIELKNKILNTKENYYSGGCMDCMLQNECLKGGYFYKDKNYESNRKKISNEMFNLLNKRNKYGFYSWYKK